MRAPADFEQHRRVAEPRCAQAARRWRSEASGCLAHERQSRRGARIRADSKRIPEGKPQVVAQRLRIDEAAPAPFGRSGAARQARSFGAFAESVPAAGERDRREQHEPAQSAADSADSHSHGRRGQRRRALTSALAAAGTTPARRSQNARRTRRASGDVLRPRAVAFSVSASCRALIPAARYAAGKPELRIARVTRSTKRSSCS